MLPERPAKPAETTSGTHVARDKRRRIASAELLDERGELIIVHAGREYRLRLTHSGKLILTA
jgi:hemin uptake protein HemP